MSIDRPPLVQASRRTTLAEAAAPGSSVDGCPARGPRWPVSVTPETPAPRDASTPVPPDGLVFASERKEPAWTTVLAMRANIASRLSRTRSACAELPGGLILALDAAPPRPRGNTTSYHRMRVVSSTTITGMTMLIARLHLKGWYREKC